MAQRRMFSKKITNTDQFLDLPLSSQALYFHLNMNADDDGFVNNVRSIIRLVGASNDDFKLLVAKQFVIAFNDGITVIRDWRIHNYIQKDRRQPTLYKKELKQLGLDENNRYIKDPNHVSNLDTECIQPVSTGKVRLGKVSKDIDKHNITTSNKTVADSKESASSSQKISKNQLDEDFNKLWKIYPVKKEKQVARKKYEKAIRDGVTNKQIQDGIISYIKEIKLKGTSKQYIKHGGTWFSQQCWEDEYETYPEPHVLNQEKPSKPKNKIDSKKKDELLKQARERDQKFIEEE